MSAMHDLYYEPWDPASRTDLFATYGRLREEAPVYRTGSGMWVISRFEDVKAVMAHPELYSNRPNQDEAVGFPPKVDQIDDETMGRLLAVVAELPLDFNELLTARMIVGADPPQHTRQRMLVSRGFVPRRIAGLSAQVQSAVEDALGAVNGRERFDLVADVATPVPVKVIADLLSVDEDHLEDVKRWSDQLATLAQSESRGSADSILALLGMLKEFSEYFVPLIESRRASPADDLISELVRAEDNDVLTATETVLFILVLMSAGNETTTNLIGNTVVALLENLDQLALLRANPELLPSAIEESIRYLSPFQFLFRETITPIALHGTTIPPGEMLVILVGAANRDPRQFEDPDRFDITRTTPHLGFGHGIHFCLGAALARMEGRAALEGLLPLLGEYRLESGSMDLLPSLLIRGFESIPMVRRRSLQSDPDRQVVRSSIGAGGAQ
jgi:cytochrome P450